MIDKKVLICGIGGQDGSYLAKFLLEKGYEVWGTSRDAEGRKFGNLISLGVFEKVHILSVSLEDYHSVYSVVSNIKPDEIYYLAGQSSVGLSFDQPAETIQSMTLGVINFLNAIRALETSTKFYNAGSSECFGDSVELCSDENTCFKPRSPYGIAKLASHLLVKNYSESYSIFACTGVLFNHESVFRPERYVTQKIIQSVKRIATGEQDQLELGRLDISRDWGWAPEYVEAMWLMLQNKTPEDFVIASGETNTLEVFVMEVFNQLGLNWNNHVTIDEALFRPTDIKVSIANPTKAIEKLNWKAKYKMREVIEMMLKPL